MGKGLWRTADVPLEKAQLIAERYGIPIRLAKWVLIRGYDDDNVEECLRPPQDWLSPFVFHDMAQAVARIQLAVEQCERICIVGDYDVDGVTSSAIVAQALDALGADWHVLIPHRVQDGYGISVPIVERIESLGCRLIVTVDNGIRADEAIQAAVGLGVDIIVTDHHEPGEHLPEGPLAIVHWAKAEQDVKVLSGACVAWKLACALLGSSHELGDWLTGLACLGALADMMPLRGEVRKLVREGLLKLRDCRNPGWVALCNIAGVKQGSLSDTHILWQISPRLNAAGRIGSARVAFDLLTAKDEETARRLAGQLEDMNQLRKQETERATAEAITECTVFRGARTTGSPGGYVVSGDWSLGIVGIVAAKLVNAYSRPTLVFSDDGGDVLRGSGRAPEGFPLLEVVQSCSEYLVHFGGHEAAVGCAVHRNQIGHLQRAFSEAAEKRFVESPAGGDFAPDAYMADDYLPLSDATMDTVRWLDALGPFGHSNPALTFYIGPVVVNRIQPLGNGKHARIQVKEGGVTGELVWFSATPDVLNWRPGMTVALVAVLERNEWQGKERAQLRVMEGYQLSQPITREMFAALYKLLRARRKVVRSDISHLRGLPDAGTVDLIFDTFVELGFAQCVESAYHVVEQAGQRDLRESIQYQNHLRNVVIKEES